jgi:hypothetical protein
MKVKPVSKAEEMGEREQLMLLMVYLAHLRKKMHPQNFSKTDLPYEIY